MYQTVSADLAEAGPSQVKSARKGRKKLMGVSRKTSTPSLSKLVTEALSASPERAGMSLVALKKTLAASGYDVVKNNSRIKLVLKSLVSKGTLVQTKGTGASGSFRLSKKVTSDLTMVKTKKSPSSKARKLVLSRESKSPKSTKTTNKRAQKPRATAAPEAARVIRKSAGTKGKPQRTSTKARADKSTAGRPKLTQHKTKKAAPKK